MEVERESIFISAIRSFARMFFAICGIFLGLFFISIFYSMLAPSQLLPEKTNLIIAPNADNTREVVSISAPAILEIRVNGVIGDPRFIDSNIVNDILID